MLWPGNAKNKIVKIIVNRKIVTTITESILQRFSPHRCTSVSGLDLIWISKMPGVVDCYYFITFCHSQADDTRTSLHPKNEIWFHTVVS